jgi:hypothetical protein
MHKKKKVKTIIVEKYKYDEESDGHHDISLYPDLLEKLLWFAHEPTTTAEQMHNIVVRMRLMMLDEDCLTVEHYDAIVTEPTYGAEPAATESPAA